MGAKKDIEYNNEAKNNLNGQYSNVIIQNLRDPYDVEIMRLAYQEIVNDNLVEGNLNINIRPTHYYIQFSPNTWNEYDSILLNYNIEFYNFPLNLEIDQIQTFDSINENTTIPTLYTIVPIDFEFKDFVHYQILGSRYYPDIDNLFPNIANKSEIILELEERAEKIANPLYFISENEGITQNSSSWHPAGNILLFDDETSAIEQNYIPLRGVQIRVRRWSKIRRTLTNENGDFYFNDNFKRPVNYSLVYHREDFDVRDGKFGQAWYNGPKSKGPWNLKITDNPHKFFGHIFQASNDYWYGYRTFFQIGSPPLNSFFRPKLKIGAIKSSNGTTNGVTHMGTRLFGIFTQINIYNQNRTSAELYSTTIHELGHSAHWWLDRTSYNNCENKVAESWCRGVQYYLTNYRYKMIGDYYNTNFIFNFSDGWQWLNTTNNDFRNHLREGYTPLVIDLIDDFNQRTANGGNYHFAPDKIKGFTLNEIWTSLSGSESLDDWKYNLIKLNKVDENNLTELFEYYKNI